VSLNILIVDDSMLIRQVVKKVIRQIGLDVGQYAEAGNGREALEQLEANEIDLVLSDINMPEMDGIEMLMNLRQIDKYRDLPVVMVSTEGSEERMNEAMELGASGYVLKPFTSERLAEQLRPLGLMPDAPAQAEAEDIDLDNPEAF
jgi:two-component system, chemotaxis family, chemotaxis protein CheY